MSSQAVDHTKAFHLVVNRYQLHDGLDLHQDVSRTYDDRNPIASLSSGRGSILEITNSLKAKQKTPLYYQFPGDARY